MIGELLHYVREVLIRGHRIATRNRNSSFGCIRGKPATLRRQQMMFVWLYGERARRMVAVGRKNSFHRGAWGLLSISKHNRSKEEYENINASHPPGYLH